MVVRTFKLKDIKNYEETNRCSLLDFIYNPSILGTLALISLGNGCCGEEEATKILEDSLEKGYGLIDIYTEVRVQLFGEKSVDTEASSEDLIDISTFKTLTELYNSFYFNIFKGTNRVGYLEFWEMSTSDIYKLFDVINIQKVNELNERLYEIYMAAALNSAAVCGKLPKQVPTVKPATSKDKNIKNKKQRLEMQVAAMKSMGEVHNKNFVMRGGT